MKNIKLLLATTAILSMSAMTANAVDVDSFNLKARVGFVQSLSADLEHELDFGIIRDPQAGDKVIIDASTGSTDGSTTRLISGTASRGSVSMEGGVSAAYSYARRGSEDFYTYGLKFSMPNKIKLTDGNGNVCGYVTNLHSSAEDDILSAPQSYYYIGGAFEIKAETGDTLVDVDTPNVNCIGQETVTIVWTDIG